MSATAGKSGVVACGGGVVDEVVGLTLSCGGGREELLLWIGEGAGDFSVVSSLNKLGWSAIHASPYDSPSSTREACSASEA